MLPFFQWLEAFGFGAGSEFTVAFINVAHLLALTVFIGAVLVVDLRLLGRGVRKQPRAPVARDAQPWFIGGFTAMAITGALQVLATPMKAYFSDQFWFKMQLLVAAVLFTFTVRLLISRADEARVGPIWGKLVGLTSIALWATIAVQGRLIGLLQ